MTQQSNIKSKEHYEGGFWEWAPYNDCFVAADGGKTGIRISDIDGHVERNGHFLWIETSRTELSAGQKRSLAHRIQRGDTAVVVFGEPNAPETMRLHKPHDIAGKEFEATEGRLRWLFRGWMLWAEANGWVEPKQKAAAQTARQAIDDGQVFEFVSGEIASPPRADDGEHDPSGTSRKAPAEAPDGAGVGSR